MSKGKQLEKVQRILEYWQRPDYRDVMLPGSPLLTCGEVADAVELQGEAILAAFQESSTRGWVDLDGYSTAEIDVLAERARQVDEEGFGTEHDDQVNAGGELAWASACYAVATGPVNPAACVIAGDNIPHALWPWALHCFRPKDRRADLVRAGALIIAEIERLDRAEARAQQEEKQA